MMPPVSDCAARLGWFRLSLGLLGVSLAGAFLIWLLIGGYGWVPSMVEIFGVAGMRTPAAISVAGLLLAAVSFREC
jgi:hypothetical protein